MNAVFQKNSCRPGSLCYWGTLPSLKYTAWSFSFVKTSRPTIKAMGSDDPLKVVCCKVRSHCISWGLQLAIKRVNSKFSSSKSLLKSNCLYIFKKCTPQTSCFYAIAHVNCTTIGICSTNTIVFLARGVKKRSRASFSGTFSEYV